jgi:polysaccharide biosynthesis protein PslH
MGANPEQMNVLVLSTQFPYPPRSGAEMRTYQLVRQLSRRHNVTLVSLIEREDLEDAAELAKQMSVRVVEHQPKRDWMKRRSQLLTLASSLPYACSEVRSHELQSVITEMCAGGQFDVVQLESALLCQYDFGTDVKLVLDEHNIEYEVLERMWRGERSALRRAFSFREYLRYRRYERRAWGKVDAASVTSPREPAIVSEHAPRLSVAVVPNGVDLQYFAPDGSDVDSQTVVFNGVLNYRPNLDAALHLVNDIWPLVLSQCPDAKLAIVGRAGGVDVSSLRGPGVEVTGEVPDVRTYLRKAAVVAVPIRMGGGTRLKVVEALALGKPIVSTTLGAEGIAVKDRETVLFADDSETFAARIAEVFRDRELALTLGRAGRRLAEDEYSWSRAGDCLAELYTRLGSSDIEDQPPAGSLPTWVHSPSG